MAVDKPVSSSSDNKPGPSSQHEVASPVQINASEQVSQDSMSTERPTSTDPNISLAAPVSSITGVSHTTRVTNDDHGFVGTQAAPLLQTLRDIVSQGHTVTSAAFVKAAKLFAAEMGCPNAEKSATTAIFAFLHVHQYASNEKCRAKYGATKRAYQQWKSSITLVENQATQVLAGTISTTSVPTLKNVSP